MGLSSRKGGAGASEVAGYRELAGSPLSGHGLGVTMVLLTHRGMGRGLALTLSAG